MTYTLKIEQDTDAQNPRTEWDNLGTMICLHRRYDLGDKDSKNYRYPEELQPVIDQPDVIALPLFLYDHGNITMSTKPFSCRFDSGQVGYIYITKEKIFKEFGWKILTKKRRAKIEEYLTNEVKTYDQYLTGDVWGYVIEDKNGDHVESCWGFHGQEYCESEGKSVLESLKKQNLAAYADGSMCEAI